jgi:hypothetical protein
MRLDMEPGDIFLDIKNKCIIECIDENRCAQHILTKGLIATLSPMRLEDLYAHKSAIRYLKKILKENGPRANIIVDGDYIENLYREANKGEKDEKG